MITDFFMAACPWIAMGLGLAIVIVYLTKRNDKNGR